MKPNANFSPTMIIVGGILFLSSAWPGMAQIILERWPLERPRITQAYGCYSCESSRPGKFHTGIDMNDGANSCGAPVYPAAKGEVVSVYFDCAAGVECRGGNGNRVIIAHPNANSPIFFTVYQHLQMETQPLVEVGDAVDNLQIPIARVGNTGSAGYPCHLHYNVMQTAKGSFEVYNGYSNRFPADDCYASDDNEPVQIADPKCVDPAQFIPAVCVKFPNRVSEIYDSPSESACRLNATIEASQVYTAMASYQAGSDVWRLIALPGEVGPSGGSTSCDQVTHGWVKNAGNIDTQCAPQIAVATGLRPESQSRGHAAEVYNVPGGTRIGYLWRGHGVAYATPISQLPPDALCDEPWFLVDLPSGRTLGNTKGYVCGEHLDENLLQCSLPLGFEAAGGCVPSPELTTLTPTSVTQGSATFEASVDPNGVETSVWFEWGPTPELRNWTLPISASNGDGLVMRSQAVGGLECGLQYYVRGVAKNDSAGIDFGQTIAFTSAACEGSSPVVAELITDGGFEGSSSSWLSLGAFHVATQSCPFAGSRYAFLGQSDGTPGNSLYGVLDQVFEIPSDAEQIELSFRYSIMTSEVGGNPYDVLTAWLYDEDGIDDLELFEAYSNLDAQNCCGAGCYRFDTFAIPDEYAGESLRLRFVGVTDNSLPSIFRLDQVSIKATVPQGWAPTASTVSASQITSFDARLNATVNPNGRGTEVWFEWDDDPNLSRETPRVDIGAGTAGRAVGVTLVNLDCGKTYFFRVLAKNAAGEAVGSKRTFTTLPCQGGPPIANTEPADNITQTSARLTARIKPNGLPTSAWFKWGLDSDPASTTPIQSFGSSTSWQDFEFTLTGLTCDKRYYFEVYAQNEEGQDDGSTYSFNTIDCGIPAPPDDFLLFADEVFGCAGEQPAVLLGWTMPPGAATIATVRTSTGAYLATIDTAISGPVFLVNLGLEPGSSYDFYVEVIVDGLPRVSNVVRVPVLSAECDFNVDTGELPHRPMVWTDRPYCENGRPRVRIWWTSVVGANSYTLQRSTLPGETVIYPNLSANSFVDIELLPGVGASYQIQAVNSSGSRSSRPFGVFIPGNVCEQHSEPGQFTSQFSAPYCELNRAKATLTWGNASSALSEYRYFEFRDHQLYGGGESASFKAELGNSSSKGHVLRAIVQAESASAPVRYREAPEVARWIPASICGISNLAPVVTTFGAPLTYAEQDRILLRGEVSPQGSETSVHFQWGVGTSYGNVTPVRLAGAGFDYLPLAESVVGLTCGKTFHFRIVASNSVATRYGSDQVISTDSCGSSLIFSDDFESGNTAKWSEAVP